MKTIIAIGGGEIGRPGYPIETTAIDKEIIRQSNKKKPRLLFIPTASSDAAGYIDAVQKHFGQRLDCQIDILYLIGKKFIKKEVEEKIFSTDIIYVGGGNTSKMLMVWGKYGVDRILKKAWEQGIVISGLSAGAVCWFRYFSSDSKKFINEKKDYQLIKLKGLDWIHFSICPHYNTEEKRERHFKKMMRKIPGTAIALDNCSAIMIQDDKYKIIISKQTACVYKVFWQDNKFYQLKLTKSKSFKPLKELFL